MKRINSIYILIAAIAVIYLPQLIFGKTFYTGDLTYLFHPWKLYAKENITNGLIPLWNPYAYCGMPFLANLQSAVFYPFSILFYIFSFPVALKLFYSMHLFIAGYFAFLFAKNLKIRSWAAAGIMMFYPFNGYIVGKQEFLSHFGTNAWLFAVLLLKDNPLILSFALVFAFLSGHYIFSVIVAILIFYYVLTTPINIKNILLKPAATAFLFTSIAAVQMLPSLELIFLSNRINSGIDSTVAFLYSLKVSDLWGILTPYLCQEPLQWNNAIYFGFTASCILIFALISYRLNIKIKIFSIILIIAGMILSLGNSLPVYPALYNGLYIFKTIRYPIQFYLLTVAGCGIFLSVALNRIRFAAIFVLFITLELVISGYNLHKTTSDSYFYYKAPSTAFLQANIGDYRFILSPGTEKNRMFMAKSDEQAWQLSRTYLYNLTSMPYHLKNAYGSGEPLTSTHIENLVNTAYQKPTPQDAIKEYYRLGVKYIICKNLLNNETGFYLNFKNPFIYSINPVSRNSTDVSECMDSEPRKRPDFSSIDNTYASTGVLRPWCFNIYSNKKKVPTSMLHNNPYSFIAGLFFTIIAIFLSTMAVLHRFDNLL